ncbi:hypothetical protein V6N12_067975 [Hibiscus sabdariffa]|uniref:C2 domain-containing protein n=1 Tax=Hibiscus sabdariffa TaxID=183260 RepID=A0ABR2FP40_9ROSI
MTTPSQQLPPQPPKTVRKVIVEVVDARHLLPKDGQGSSSPSVIADFDGQKKRTSTKYRDLISTPSGWLSKRHCAERPRRWWRNG